MATYLTRAKYSNDAFKGMIAKPQNRSAAAKTVFKAAGMKLGSVFFSPSTGEVICVAEGDAVQVSALSMAVMASGVFSSISTIELVNMADMMKAMEAAAGVGQKYVPPFSTIPPAE